MAAGPSLQEEDGMGGLVLAQGGGEGHCLLPEFGIRGAGEKHPLRPLGWREGPDRIAEDAQIRLVQGGNEAGCRGLCFRFHNRLIVF